MPIILSGTWLCSSTEILNLGSKTSKTLKSGPKIVVCQRFLPQLQGTSVEICAWTLVICAPYDKELSIKIWAQIRTLSIAKLAPMHSIPIAEQRLFSALHVEHFELQ